MNQVFLAKMNLKILKRNRNDSMNKIITIRVTQEDFEYITKECKKERLPKSAWIRRKLLFKEINN